MPSLYEVMAKDNKSGEKISMGYGISDYDKLINEYLQKDQRKIVIKQDNINQNGTGIITGAYIPGVNELVANNVDVSSVLINEKGFSIGKDEDKKIAVLSFVPRRGYIAVDKKNDKTHLCVTKSSSLMDNREFCGHSILGNYVSPPASLKKEIIESGKDNSESGSYRVGCGIDVEGMFKNYLMHFYPNDEIGTGLSSGSIPTNKLTRLVAERCLYAEISFGNTMKTLFMAVTDSVKIGQSETELYIHIDAPLCTTSALESIIEIKTNSTNELESVNYSSEYDFKKGKLKGCDVKSYTDYANRCSDEQFEAQISLRKNMKLGVRFFSLAEKKQQIENIIGKMPEDFYKSSSSFKLDISSSIVYSGVEFVRGNVQEARNNFLKIRGEVPEEILTAVRKEYAEFKTHLNDRRIRVEHKLSSKNNVVGVDCSYFIIPEGYPIGLAHRVINKNIYKELTTRDLSVCCGKKSLLMPNMYADGVPTALFRGYDDSVYQKIYQEAKGQVAIKCNLFAGRLWTAIFAAILNYYGGENLPKIVPSMCFMICCGRTKAGDPSVRGAGWAHRTGRAIDFDRFNNYGRRGTCAIYKGRHTNYKGVLDIMRAGGVGWPIPDNNGVPDYMHFQIGPKPSNGVIYEGWK